MGGVDDRPAFMPFGSQNNSKYSSGIKIWWFFSWSEFFFLNKKKMENFFFK